MAVLTLYTMRYRPGIDGQAVNSPRCSVVHQAGYWLQGIGISLDLIRNNTRAPRTTTVIGACYTINATRGAFDCTDQVRQIVCTTLGVLCNESKSARTRPLLASSTCKWVFRLLCYSYALIGVWFIFTTRWYTSLTRRNIQILPEKESDYYTNK